jgi:hypothetical protein
LVMILRFELMAVCLLSRCSTTGTTLLTLFVLVIFQIGSSVFAWADLNQSPPMYTLCVAGMAGMCHHTQPSWLKTVSC